MRHLRLGKFVILTHALENDIDLVKRIFCMVVPIRCEQRYDLDGFRYTGISDQFDIVKPGFEIPEYIIEIKKNEFYSTFRFIKSGEE